MNTSDKDYFAIGVEWQRQEDVFFPYQAQVGEQIWVLRLNEFPEEPLFTLFIDNREILDFSNWSSAWKKPRE